MANTNPPSGVQPLWQRLGLGRFFGIEEGLISRASVLWLSGVLIGMAVSGDLLRPSNLYYLDFGVFGFVAYVALEVAARHRWRAQMEERLQQLLADEADWPGTTPPLSRGDPVAFAWN